MYQATQQVAMRTIWMATCRLMILPRSKTLSEGGSTTQSLEAGHLCLGRIPLWLPMEVYRPDWIGIAVTRLDLSPCQTDPDSELR